MLIATWNTQGNCLSDGKLAGLVHTYPLDVICVQECGNLLDSCFPGSFRQYGSLYIGSYNFGTQSRGIVYNVIYYPWRGGCRCSMATFVRCEYEILDYSLKPYNLYRRYTSDDENSSQREDADDDTTLELERKGLRDMLQTVIEYDNRAISINNVHLPSGCPKFAKNVALWFRFLCRYHNCNYIMIGDMNVPVEMWENSFFMHPHIPECTGETHQNGSILDYMFTDMSVWESGVANAYYGSDHLFVLYDVEY